MKRFALFLALALPAAADDRSFPTECGRSVIELLEGADRVETWRIQGERAEKPDATCVNGYPVIAKGPDLKAEFAAKILATLRHEGTTFPGMKECAMEPGFVFRAWKGKTALEVLICFHCQQLQVVTHPEKGDPVEITGDFDGAPSQWLALCREAFPDDLAVKGLTAAIEGPAPAVRKLFGDQALGIIRALFLNKLRRVTASGTADCEEIPRETYLAAPMLLLVESSWDFGAAAPAEFHPDLEIELMGHDDALLVVRLSLATCDAEWTVTPKSGDPVKGRGNLGNARDAFLGIAKGAFPEDEAIQAMKEKPKR